MSSSYDLDSVAAHLIERLEATRRTWEGDSLAPGVDRVVSEELAAIKSEHEEVFREPWPATREREIRETFQPRYVRLATEHAGLEQAGYGSWRGGDPLARLMALAGGMLIFLMMSRVLPGPLKALGILAVALLPLIPELRAAWFRRQYQGQLQGLVDDLGRIEERMGAYLPAGLPGDELEPSPDPLATDETQGSDAEARRRDTSRDRERS